MSNINAALEIERLLKYGEHWGLLGEWDVISARNALMEIFELAEPFEGVIEEEIFSDSPMEILNPLLDYAAEAGILEVDSVTYRDLLDTKIMAVLMPRPSEVIEQFLKNAKEKSKEAATEEYYSLSKASNYIRMDRIKKNLYWLSPTEYGDLEITVNLSKPEKDPKAIAAERNIKQSGYPKCLLCLENVGYPGRLNHPARQNHRVIPLTLDEEQWFLQYSPYVYYNEHCIVFSQEHRPMKISEATFVRVLDFVEELPHYFIGSNADLPIVGGSILSHDHFQGGHHIFPMEKASVEKTFHHPKFPEIKAGLVKWPMSVIRISGKNKKDLVKLAMHILDQWREYSDPEVEILSYSEEKENKVPHNTVTPIARRNGNQEFEMDLVLRNNRTSKEHPDGIFHPHKELHHIKKENIGLIEVMGLAVLPGRLDEEMKKVEEVLTGNSFYDEETLLKDSDLQKHGSWIKELVEKYGTKNQQEGAHDLLQNEIGNKFTRVLEDAGVFKRNDTGIKAFEGCMEKLGFVKK